LEGVVKKLAGLSLRDSPEIKRPPPSYFLNKVKYVFMKTGKIVFVGLHNKPNMKPLDLKTKSGKLIQRIIDYGNFINVLLTNLFDVDEFPTNEDEQYMLAKDWYDRIEPEDNDIIVLLGQQTHLCFIQRPELKKIIKVAHPASKRSNVDMTEYVLTTSDKIKEKLK
jgi:hypothetical protein